MSFGIRRHWDGAAWTVALAAANVIEIKGFAANDVVAVTQKGAIHHWDGAT